MVVALLKSVLSHCSTDLQQSWNGTGRLGAYTKPSEDAFGLGLTV